MQFDVMTLFPEMFNALTQFGVTGKAFTQKIYSLDCWNPRELSGNKHGFVDDRPYGGGPGMVMQAEPLEKTVLAIRERRRIDEQPPLPLVYLSPQGKRLTQAMVDEFAQSPGLALLAGRYEGVDQRFIDRHVDAEISVGDYVLSGGELPAMMLIDAIVRKLPGVLGNEESAEQDSFCAGLLDCEHYTRPETLHDERVPDVLLSGDHAAIKRWRLKQALGRTWLKRPDMLAQLEQTTGLSSEQHELLKEFKRERKH